MRLQLDINCLPHSLSLSFSLFLFLFPPFFLSFSLSLSLPLSPQDLRSLIPDHSYSIVGKIANGSVHLIFPTSSQAIKGIQAVNRLNKDKRDKRLAIQASYCRPDSLLFIGNIPLWFNKENLRQLFTPLGTCAYMYMYIYMYTIIFSHCFYLSWSVVHCSFI